FFREYRLDRPALPLGDNRQGSGVLHMLVEFDTIASLVAAGRLVQSLGGSHDRFEFQAVGSRDRIKQHFQSNIGIQALRRDRITIKALSVKFEELSSAGTIFRVNVRPGIRYKKHTLEIVRAKRAQGFRRVANTDE